MAIVRWFAPAPGWVLVVQVWVVHGEEDVTIKALRSNPCQSHGQPINLRTPLMVMCPCMPRMAGLHAPLHTPHCTPGV